MGNEKELQIKNGQVSLLTSADYFSAKKSFEIEQRDSYRQQWQFEAEQRLARIEAKKSPLEKAGESSLKTQKFAWSKEGQKSFEWRKIYHALLGGVGGMPEGGIATECLISPTAMRMYTDHRVMGAVVLPGVAHCGDGLCGLPQPRRLGERLAHECEGGAFRAP